MTQGIALALMGVFLLSAPALASGSAATSPVKTEQTLTATITGFNAVAGQTDDDPLITASGAYSNPEVVAARSPDLAKQLPFGTIIDIEPTNAKAPGCGYNAVKDSIGLRVIADVMNPKMHDKVDVLFAKSDTVNTGSRKMNAALVLGICKNFTVRVVGHVAIANIPKTQTGLATLVDNNGSLAVK